MSEYKKLHKDVVYKFNEVTRENTTDSKILDTINTIESMDKFIQDNNIDKETFDLYESFLLRLIELITFVNSQSEIKDFCEICDCNRSYEETFNILWSKLDTFLNEFQEKYQSFKQNTIENLRNFTKEILEEIGCDYEKYTKHRETVVKQQHEMTLFTLSMFLTSYLIELREKDKQGLKNIYKTYLPKELKGNLVKLTKIQKLTIAMIVKGSQQYGEVMLVQNPSVLFTGLIKPHLVNQINKKYEDFKSISDSELDSILNQFDESNHQIDDELLDEINEIDAKLENRKETNGEN